MAVVFGAPAPRPHGTSRSSSGGPLKVRTRKGDKRSFRIGGKPWTPEDMADWLGKQVNRPNLAHEAHDQVAPHAIQYVQQMRQWHEERTFDVRRKWQILDAILRGESLAEVDCHGDIHVAELYKKVETIVPRIVEAILQYRPFFKVDGRDSRDRRRSTGIEAWLLYQLDRNHFEEEVEPWVRAMIVYQFSAWKVWWDYEFTDVVNRYYEEKDGPDGTMNLEVTCKDETVLSFESNKVKLVDPYQFIFDPTQTRVQDMEFVGDVCMMREDDLRRYADMGMFCPEQVADLLEGVPVNSFQNESQWQRQERRLTSTYDLDMTRRSKNQPKQYEVVEMWALYRPTPDEPIHRYKIVVANGTHLLELRRNPHDDQHVPYAVARAAKEPFDFLNVGVLDHAIPLQIEFDDHRRLAMRSHRNAVAPPVWLDPSSDDAPLSLWDVEPGRIYRGTSPPMPLKLPTTLGEMIGMEEVMRRDIEEIVGAPSVFDGGGANNTATEVQRKIEEGNRRMRRLIYAFSGGLVDMMQIMLANTRQFVTPQKAMSVLNGEFMALHLQQPLQPEDLADPVNITIRGLRGLSQNNLHATLYVQFLTQMGPLLPSLIQKGTLNVEELVYRFHQAVVGQELDDQILKRPKPRDAMLSPELENVMFEQGGMPEVHPDDPDAMHVAEHTDALEGGRFTERQAQNVLEHIAQHERAMDSKAARRRAAMAEQTPSFQPSTPANPRASDAKGRYDQPADLMGQATAASMPGETPGPADPARMAAMDRQQPVPQEVNRNEG